MKSKDTLNSFFGLLRPLLLLLLLLAPHAGNAAEQAPDFELADLSGTVHRLSAYRGRVVVLNFWATWCTECVRELPSLDLFARSRPDVVVLAIASDRAPEVVRRFVAERSLGFPVIVDGTGDVFVRKYLVRTLPTTVLIGRDGALAARLFGAVDFTGSRFGARIERLATSSP